MYGYIYLTTNKVNGMKYIGQHAKPEFDENYYGSGMLLIKSIQKYGKENFTREILAWAETKEELDKLEIELIDKYEAVESDEYYNIAIGGNVPMTGRHHTEESKEKNRQSHLGVKLSEETRKKISYALKGKLSGENHPMCGKYGELNPNYGNHKLAGENHPNWGKHWSEETRKKISESLKGKLSGENHPMWGKRHSEETRKKISEARAGMKPSEEARQKMRDSSHHLSGEYHPMYGKHHSEEARKKMSEANKKRFENKENHPRCKPVVQLTLEGEFVKEYEYMSQAEQFGFSRNSIGQCCRGKKESYKGFKWMYKAEYDELNT